MTTNSQIVCAISMALALTVNGSNAATCYNFNVVTQGVNSIGDTNTISASNQFQTRYYLIARVPGVRGNMLDIVLHSNKDLNANGQVGDILLMSNSLWAQNSGIRSSLTDMMSVNLANSQNGQFVQFQVNTDASNILPPANTFVAPGIGNTSGGIGGICFLPGLQGLCQSTTSSQILSASFIIPRSGVGYFESSDGWSTLHGQIQLSGSIPDNFNFTGYSNAEMGGRFIGASECN